MSGATAGARRAAAAVLSRCSRVAATSISTPTSTLVLRPRIRPWPCTQGNCRSATVVNQFVRQFSDRADSDKKEQESLNKWVPTEFLKTPVAPLKAFMTIMKNTALFTQSITEFQITPAEIVNLIEFAEKSVSSSTERLKENDFDSLSDHLTSWALKDAEKMVSNLSPAAMSVLCYDPDRPSIINRAVPWCFRKVTYGDRSCVEFSFCILQILMNGSHAVWGISFLKSLEDSTYDNKISQLHFSYWQPE